MELLGLLHLPHQALALYGYVFRWCTMVTVNAVRCGHTVTNREPSGRSVGQPKPAGVDLVPSVACAQSVTAPVAVGSRAMCGEITCACCTPSLAAMPPGRLCRRLLATASLVGISSWMNSLQRSLSYGCSRTVLWHFFERISLSVAMAVMHTCDQQK